MNETSVANVTPAGQVPSNGFMTAGAVASTFSIAPYDYAIRMIDPADPCIEGICHNFKAQIAAAVVATPTAPGVEPWGLLVALPEKIDDGICVDVVHAGANGVHAQAVANLFNALRVGKKERATISNESVWTHRENERGLSNPFGFVNSIVHTKEGWVAIDFSGFVGTTLSSDGKFVAHVDENGLIDWFFAKTSRAKVKPYVFSTANTPMLELFKFLLAEEHSIGHIPGIDPERYGYTVLDGKLALFVASSLDGFTVDDETHLTFERHSTADVAKIASQFNWYVHATPFAQRTEIVACVGAIGLGPRNELATSSANHNVPNLVGDMHLGFVDNDDALIQEIMRKAVLVAVAQTGFLPSKATMIKLKIKDADLPVADIGDDLVPIPGTALAWLIRPTSCVLTEGLDEVATIDRKTGAFSFAPCARIEEIAAAYVAAKDRLPVSA